MKTYSMWQKKSEELMRSVNLVTYAQSYGYTINKDKSTKAAVVMQKDNHDIIVRRDKDTGFYYYNTRHNNLTDKGSIINFERSRNPGRSFFEAIETISRFDGSHIEHVSVELGEKKKHSDSISLLESLKPLTDITYLQKRGISRETIESSEFENRIYNSVKNYKGKMLKNIAFPMYNSNGIVGIVNRNDNFKGNAPGSNNSESIWVSRWKSEQEIVSIEIVENPIDALSKHQLKSPKSSVVYIATNGPYSSIKCDLIQSIIDKVKPKRIALSNDNDTTGAQYNLNYILNLRSHAEQAQSVKLSGSASNYDKWTSAVTINITKTTGLKEYEQSIENGLIKSLEKQNENVICTKSLDKYGLEYKITYPRSKHNHDVIFDCISSIKKHHKIVLERSIANDFNDDLKITYLLKYYQEGIKNHKGYRSEIETEEFLRKHVKDFNVVYQDDNTIKLGINPDCIQNKGKGFGLMM